MCFELVQWLDNADTENGVILADLHMPMSNLLFPIRCDDHPYNQNEIIEAVLMLTPCTGIEVR